MKKYTKSAHLQGNTTVATHSSPYIQGTIAVSSDGTIPGLAALATPWSKTLGVQTDQGAYVFTFTDTSTNNGTLSDIVSLINNDATNNNTIIASAYGGVLKLQAASTGEGSYIRINDSADTMAYLLGFTTYPHSTSIVYSGDLISAAVNAADQGNPNATTFLADGEDRSSENYNRGLASTLENVDSNRHMLLNPLGYVVNIKLSQNSPRYLKTSSGLVYGINLSTSISDAFTSILQNRLLVGTITKDSPVRDIRNLYRVTNTDGDELTYVKSIISGTPTTTPVSNTLSLNDTPNAASTVSARWKDGGLALSANSTKTVSYPITSFIDAYTVECASAAFVTSSVAPGDILRITGSLNNPYSNDKDYLIEKVLSETMLEVQPLSHGDVAPFTTGSIAGSAQVFTGGMWTSECCVILSEFVANIELLLSIPLEEITGDLPADALVEKDIVEISVSLANILNRTRTLSDSYNNAIAPDNSAGGFAIDISNRPVHINGANTSHTPVSGTPTTVNVNILANNVLKINGSGSFDESQIGSVCLLTTVQVSGIPGKADVIHEEPVIIENVVSLSEIQIQRVRNTEPLPVSTTIYGLDIYAKNPTVTLPGTLVNRVSSVGGIFTVLDGEQSAASPTALESELSFATLDTIKQLQPTTTTGSFSSVAKVVAISASAVTAELVNADMINGLYLSEAGRHALVCHIINGPNSGYYLVNTVVSATQQGITKSEISLKTLHGQPASIQATSTTQYISLMYCVTATSMGIGSSKAANSVFVTSYDDSNPSVGLSVQGAGNNILMRVSSNANTTISDLTAGFASKGTNIQSIAGPGVDYNLYLHTEGISGWDYTSQVSAAPVSIGSRGLGGTAIYSSTETYHNSPLDNPNFYDISSVAFSSGGGNRFRASGPDAAVTVESNNPLILKKDFVTEASLVVGNDSYYKGAISPAIAIYGNIYAPQHDSTKSVWYTEADITASSLLSSDPSDVDASSNWNSKQTLGNDWVVARVQTGSNKKASLIERDYTKFNIPHEFIVKIENIVVSSTSEYVYDTIFSSETNYVGSLVFIQSPDPGLQSVSDLERDVGTATHPFGMQDEVSFTGPAKGFRIIAQSIVGGHSLYAVEALNSTGTLRRIENVTNINLVFTRKPFSGRVDIATSTAIGRTDYRPVTYSYEQSNVSTKKHPVLFSRELDREVSTNVAGLPKSVTKDGSLLFGTETYWNTPIVDILTPYAKHNTAISTAPANQFKTSGTATESTSKSFFTRKITVHSLLNNVTTSSPSHYVSDGGGFDLPSPYNQQGYQAFRGGGSKLVLFSKFWDETQQRDTFHFVRYAVGSSLLSQQSHINVEMQVAHLSNEDKEVKIKLCTPTEVLAEKTFNVYSGYGLQFPPLTTRGYRKHSILFSSYELDAASIPDQQVDLFIELEARTKSGYVRHTSLSGQSDSVMDKLGKTIFYREDYYGGTNLDLHDFPDAVFIADMNVKVESTHAALTSGLDVEGIVNTRALRLSRAVRGFNTIGPASVDLLQNTEYGSLHGNGELPNEELQAVAPFGQITEGFSREGTIEGNDVGLLPLWKALFPDVATLSVLEYINRKNASYDDATGAHEFIVISNPTRQLREEDIVSSDGSIPHNFSNYNIEPLIVNRSDYTLSELVFNNNLTYKLNGVQDIQLTPSSNVVNVNVDAYVLDYTLPSNRNIAFYGAHVFVTFYKPTYDKATFFRKGVHSAAIHGYHPYYDPMFYWFNAAYGINKGRGFTEETGTTDNAELGSFRLNRTTTYVNLTNSKVNPDAVKLPGKTGFIIPLDPPHGARLTKLDINLSIRPMVSRKLNKTDNTPSAELNYSYGIWKSTPSLDENGTQWLGRDFWNVREGYIVKIWRHSLFDSGNYVGDPATDPLTSTTKTVSNHSVPLHGGAECIYKKEVNLRTTAGNPSNYADSTANIIKEAVSRFSETLSSNGNMVANREVYSYFATVEFYIGVRKEKPFTNADSSGDLDCYTIPGLAYSHMDHYNSIHFPYMWNTMYSHNPPTEGISYGNGMAESSLWQGLWVPHGDPFRNKYYEQGIVRGHPLNRAYDTTNAPINSYLSKSMPTTRADVTSVYTDGQFPYGNTSRDVPLDTTSASYSLKVDRAIQAFRELYTTVPNQQLWYPIVKFRGARLTYLIDRPGHGGWGGDIS